VRFCWLWDDFYEGVKKTLGILRSNIVTNQKTYHLLKICDCRGDVMMMYMMAWGGGIFSNETPELILFGFRVDSFAAVIKVHLKSLLQNESLEYFVFHGYNRCYL